MKIDLDYELGIINKGNLGNIKQIMKKAINGDEITIGFIGGSITQGALASNLENCYAYFTYKWWCRAFPKAKIKFVNAGIGATDSQFGCARVESDLLCHKPDFVIVEFAVNDYDTSHYLETYEGLVRKILGSSFDRAVMLVYNVYYDTGISAQNIHEKIAKYYDLPSVSMKNCIYQKFISEKLDNRIITPDDLHPNDYGHELVSSVINYYLEKILNSVDEIDADDKSEDKYKKPMSLNAYEDSIRYQNYNSEPTLSGFTRDDSVQYGITDIFKNGWFGKSVGDKIEFEIQGSCIGVQYRRTIKLPAPIARLVVDDNEENAFILDANFDETWGDKMVLDTVLEHGGKGIHKVCIEIIEAHEGDVLPFYLVSVIGSGL